MRELKPPDLVVELLKTLRLAESDFDPRAGNGGVLLMPSLYHLGSYQELECRLREMRDDAVWYPRWRHVSGRYLWGWPKRKLVVRYRKTTHGRVPELPGHAELQIVGEPLPGTNLMTVYCYTWSKWVNPLVVREGVQRLVATMYDGDTTKLHLPLPLLYQALGLPPREERDREQPKPRDVQSPPLAPA